MSTFPSSPPQPFLQLSVATSRPSPMTGKPKNRSSAWAPLGSTDRSLLCFSRLANLENPQATSTLCYDVGWGPVRAVFYSLGGCTLPRPGSPALPATKTSSAFTWRRGRLTRTPARSRWTDLRWEEVRKKGSLWGCDQARTSHPRGGNRRRTLSLDSRKNKLFPSSRWSNGSTNPWLFSWLSANQLSWPSLSRASWDVLWSCWTSSRSRQEVSELAKHGNEVGLGVLVFEFSTTRERQYNYSWVCKKPHLFLFTVDICRYITNPTGRTMSFRSKRMIHSAVHSWSVKKAQEMIQFSLCRLCGLSSLGSIIQGDHPKLNEEWDVFKRGEEESIMLQTCWKMSERGTKHVLSSIHFLF